MYRQDGSAARVTSGVPVLLQLAVRSPLKLEPILYSKFEYTYTIYSNIRIVLPTDTNNDRYVLQNL